jgi:hypothetical protein
MALRPIQFGETHTFLEPNQEARDGYGVESDASVIGAATRLEFLPGANNAKWRDHPGPLTTEESEQYTTGAYDYEQDPVAKQYLGTDYESEFARYGQSPRHTQWVANRINQELADRKTIDEGGVTGFLASTAAAMLSPEQYPMYFIPGTMLLKPGILTGSRATLGYIGGEAAVAAASTALSEVALHSTQVTRTQEESLYAISASAIFGGLFTAGIAGAKGGFDGLTKLDAEIKALDDADRIIDMDKSVGAAASKEDIHATHQRLIQERQIEIEQATARGEQPNPDTVRQLEELQSMKPQNLTELKHPKLAKAMGFASPAIRLATSRFSATRELSASLIDDPMSRVRNGYGDTLEPSVESRMTQFENEMGNRLNQITTDIYNQYKKLAKENKEQVMKYQDFASEISKALRKGDTHDNPLVQQAAVTLRKDVLRPIEDRLAAQDLLPREISVTGTITREDLVDFVEPEELDALFKKDGTPKANFVRKLDDTTKAELVKQGKLSTDIKIPVGDESYLHRMWDHTRITADQGLSFRKKVADWIEQEALKAKRDDLMGDTLDDIVEIDAAIKAKEEKIAKSKAKNKGRVKDETPEQAQARREATEKARLAHEGEEPFKAPKRTDVQILNDMKAKKADLEVRLERKRQEFENSKNAIWKSSREAAKQIYNDVIGTTYSPSTGADTKVHKVGPLKLRTLDIPSEIIEEFLINDVDQVINHYVRSISPQLHIKERFEPEAVDSVKLGLAAQSEGGQALERHIAEVNSMYEAEINNLSNRGNIKEAKKAEKERRVVIEDLEAMRDQLFNRYKMPVNPDNWWVKAAARLREFNVLTMLGGVTVSSIPDLGNYIARRGMMTMSRDIMRWTTSFKEMKLAARTLEKYGIAGDIENAGRLEKMYLMDNEMPSSSPLWNNTRKVFSKATLMPYWNNGLKTMAAVSFTDDLVVDALKAASGKLSRKQIEAYARGGISLANLKKMAAEMTPDQKIGNIHVPDYDKWLDQNLAEVIKAAIKKEVDTVVITPGKGDLPLWTKGEVGKTVAQFKSFAFAANQRLLMANLDDFNANKMAGLIASITLGYVSYAAKQTLKGEDFETDYDAFIREGLDRSGQLAFWGDLNGMISKATQGEVDLHRLLGADAQVMSRYASRNMLGTLLGISAGRVGDISQFIGAISKGEFSESDIRAVRRAIIFNNLWATHYGFSQLEKSTYEALQ